MRALNDAEKAQRRDALADQAAHLFAELGYAKLTMEALARASGVAKGTVFLAFATKEDVVLHAAGRRFEAWFQRLIGIDPSVSAPLFARAILASLRGDGLLMPLLTLVGPVLEQGCSPEAVVRFKQVLASNLAVLATAWAPRVPWVPAEAWGPLFLQVHALIVGAWTVGEASDNVVAALEAHPELQGLLTPFDELVVPLLEAQLSRIARP